MKQNPAAHVHVRPFCAERDIPFVCEAQLVAYAPQFHESRESFVAKANLFPPGCFAAEVEGRFAGYCFSFPTCCTAVPIPLDCADVGELVGRRRAPPDCYYIHDLCVLPWAQGMGVGRALMTAVLQVASRLQLDATFLVAVQGSVPFWSRAGFDVVTDLSAPVQKTLSKYGSDARLMRMPGREPSLLALT